MEFFKNNEIKNKDASSEKKIVKNTLINKIKDIDTELNNEFSKNIKEKDIELFKILLTKLKENL